MAQATEDDSDFMKRLFEGPSESEEKLDMKGEHNKDWRGPHFEIKKPMLNGVMYEGCVCLQPQMVRAEYTDEEKEEFTAAMRTVLNMVAGKGQNFLEVTLNADGRVFKMRVEIREIRE